MATHQVSGHAPGRLDRLLVEPRRPGWVRARPGAHWLVVAAVCVGAVLGQLDASIVTLAVPTLQRTFHARLAGTEWVLLAYLLVLVVSVIPVGRFSDMVGRKLVYTYGFAVFTAASLACGLATSLGMLIAFRCVQALGAAMLQANSVALITVAVPRRMLGRAIGVQGAAQAAGLALGPTVGGLLIGLGGWRLIFLANVPIGIIGVVLGWLLIPRSRELAARVRFDWIGLAWFAPTVSAVFLAITLATVHGLGSPLPPALLTAATAGAWLFARHEVRVPSPMLDLSLFTRRAFSYGVGAGLISYLVLFGVLFVAPVYAEQELGTTVLVTGLELGALPLALAITAPVAGRLADHIGPRMPTVVGMLTCSAFLLLLANSDGNRGVILVALAGIGAGLGAFTPANNASIMASAPRTHSGTAGGVINMSRGLGTSFGVAVTGLVFELAAHHHVAGAGTVGLERGFVTAVYVLAVFALLAAFTAMLAARTNQPVNTL